MEEIKQVKTISPKTVLPKKLGKIDPQTLTYVIFGVVSGTKQTRGMFEDIKLLTGQFEAIRSDGQRFTANETALPDIANQEVVTKLDQFRKQNKAASIRLLCAIVADPDTNGGKPRFSAPDQYLTVDIFDPLEGIDGDANLLMGKFSGAQLSIPNGNAPISGEKNPSQEKDGGTGPDPKDPEDKSDKTSQDKNPGKKAASK